jgi:hypothetical protein
LATLCALAEYPEYVKRIFCTQEMSESGIYSVKLILGGIEYKVSVDDYIPYNNQLKRVAFSKSKVNDIWIMILEKVSSQIQMMPPFISSFLHKHCSICSH